MQSTSFLNLQASERYKTFLKENSETKVTEETEAVKDTKQLTQNVFVEKKEDTYILSSIDDQNLKTILSEIKATSQFGLELSDYFKNNTDTDLENNLSQVNAAIKSTSLVDYL